MYYIDIYSRNTRNRLQHARCRTQLVVAGHLPAYVCVCVCLRARVRGCDLQPVTPYLDKPSPLSTYSGPGTLLNGEYRKPLSTLIRVKRPFSQSSLSRRLSKSKDRPHRTALTLISMLIRVKIQKAVLTFLSSQVVQSMSKGRPHGVASFDAYPSEKAVLIT